MKHSKWRLTKTGNISGSFVLILLLLVSVNIQISTFYGSANSTNNENRSASEFNFLLNKVFKEESWQDLSLYLDDHFPLRDKITLWYRNFEKKFFARKRFGDVLIGDANWMFYRPSIVHLWADPIALQSNLTNAINLAKSRQTELIFTSIPDKVSIYNHKLGYAQALYERTLSDRLAIQEVIRGLPQENHLDVWALFKGMRSSIQDQLYYPRDTHWNHIGSQIFARALVEKIQPGIWEPSAIKIGNGRLVTRDLTRLAGFEEPKDLTNSLSIHREGILETQAWTMDGVISNTNKLPIGARHGHKPLRILSKAAPKTNLISDRTLIIHDSFVVQSHKLFWPYFADLTYLHRTQVQPGDFRVFLERFDKILVITVERDIGSWLQFLSLNGVSSKTLIDALEIEGSSEY